jgi:hypothetical protein
MLSRTSSPLGRNIRTGEFLSPLHIHEEVSVADSECAFAYGLAWVGKRLSPGGGPIRHRGNFPTWSWTSMVDQIETKDKDYAVYFRTYKCSAFYVEDENHKRLRIVEVFNSAQERRAIIPEYGKTLLIEAYVAKVWLRLTEKEGIYSIHIPNNTIQDQTSPTPSLLTISGQGVIDGGDTDILSKIESQPWDAVKLFWRETSLNSEQTDEGYWMLVDLCSLIARRIGLITPDTGGYKDKLRMEILTAEKKLIRIE